MTIDIKQFLGLLLVVVAVMCVFGALQDVPKGLRRDLAIGSLALLAGVSFAYLVQ